MAETYYITLMHVVLLRCIDTMHSCVLFLAYARVAMALVDASHVHRAKSCAKTEEAAVLVQDACMKLLHYEADTWKFSSAFCIGALLVT